MISLLYGTKAVLVYKHWIILNYIIVITLVVIVNVDITVDNCVSQCLCCCHSYDCPFGTFLGISSQNISPLSWQLWKVASLLVSLLSLLLSLLSLLSHLLFPFLWLTALWNLLRNSTQKYKRSLLKSVEASFLVVIVVTLFVIVVVTFIIVITLAPSKN